MMDIMFQAIKNKKTMKKLFKNITYILTLSIALFAAGCGDDIADEVTSIDANRLFSPVDLEARVVNRTNVRLSWKAVNNAKSYNIEVYNNGNEDYTGTPLKSVENVLFTETPYTIIGLEGDENYSIRVQAISDEIAESKWIGITIKTDTEQIFEALDEANDLEATTVTLRWPAGEVATEIILTPGDIRYSITANDIAAGAATLTGLTPETKYTARMVNGAKTRGTIAFETPLDLGGAIAVSPGDDFIAMIAAAEDGDVFAVLPSETPYVLGKLSITKSISIKAAKPSDKPVLFALISLEDNVAFELKDVILDGTGAVEEGVLADQAIQFNKAGDYKTVSVVGCEIRNYLKGLLYFNVAGIAESITFDNNIIHDIVCDGGDLFDCREGTAAQINFTNNTVYNCALARDFFRIDSKTLAVSPSLFIDHNTFYNVSNGSSRRILYVRWPGNQITFTNNILANTAGYYSNQSSTNIVTMGGNNYFEAPNFTASTVSNAKNDTSGDYTTLDPGFANPSEGNFTLSNEDLKYDKIGDPRWW